MSQNSLHVIALACSPSHGRNSDTMLDSFIEGLKKHKDIIVEKIYLDSIYIETYKFENCTGTQDDEKDFKLLTEKIKSSQGLVIATPTYNFSVPAHLKNFIDRIRFFALAMDKRNMLSQPVGLLRYLKTYFLVSGGTPHWAQRLFFIIFPPFWLRFIFLYYGSSCLGSYYVGDTSSFKNPTFQKECYKRGTKYGTQLKNSKRIKPKRWFSFKPPQKY